MGYNQFIERINEIWRFELIARKLYYIAVTVKQFSKAYK